MLSQYICILSLQGGSITRERVVVLFFFCADVAIQALRQGLHRTFHRLIEWSLRYIATQVAAWVHSCGGWVMKSMLILKHYAINIILNPFCSTIRELFYVRVWTSSTNCLLAVPSSLLLPHASYTSEETYDLMPSKI